MCPGLTQAEVLVLKAIHGMPSYWSIYQLTRFFAKTDIAVTFYEDLRKLVDKNLIFILDPTAQVEVYKITYAGQQLLEAEYKTDDIKDYVLEIEPTGFVLKMLYIMDSNLKRNNES
jgi:hypothetical protein